MWAWVRWNRPPEDKEGPLCGPVWTLERLKMYVRALMKVFSYCVYSTGALCLPDAQHESDGNETRASGIYVCLFVLLLIRNSVDFMYVIYVTVHECKVC